MSSSSSSSSWRAGVARIFYWVNLAMFFLEGIALLLAPDAVVKGMVEATRPVTRAAGALNICYGLLLAALGPLHHGGYCITMLFHMMVAGAVAAEAASTTLEAAFKMRVAGIALGHAIAATLMLGLLMSGGIGHKSHEKNA